MKPFIKLFKDLEIGDIFFFADSERYIRMKKVSNNSYSCVRISRSELLTMYSDIHSDNNTEQFIPLDENKNRECIIVNYNTLRFDSLNIDDKFRLFFNKGEIFTKLKGDFMEDSCGVEFMIQGDTLVELVIE